jgi:hypothetical protein
VRRRNLRGRSVFADAPSEWYVLKGHTRQPAKSKTPPAVGEPGTGFANPGVEPRQRLTEGPGTGCKTPHVSFGAVRAPHAEVSARGFDRSTQQGSIRSGRAGFVQKIRYALEVHCRVLHTVNIYLHCVLQKSEARRLSCGVRGLDLRTPAKSVRRLPLGATLAPFVKSMDVAAWTQQHGSAGQYCRHCGTQLKVPVDNEHHAFCSRGCHSSFYRSRCLVCEQPFPRKNERQRFGLGHKLCAAEYERFTSTTSPLGGLIPERPIEPTD